MNHLSKFGLLALAFAFVGCNSSSSDDTADNNNDNGGKSGSLARAVGGFMGGGSATNPDDTGSGGSGGEGGEGGSSGDTGGDVPSGTCQTMCANIIGCVVSVCNLEATAADISAAASECAPECTANASSDDIDVVSQLTANNCAGFQSYQDEICAGIQGEFDDIEDDGEGGSDDWDEGGDDDVGTGTCNISAACEAAQCMVNCNCDQACATQCIISNCGSQGENCTCDDVDDSEMASTCGISEDAFEACGW